MDRRWGLVFIWVSSPLWISLFSGSLLVLVKAELTWTRRAAEEAEAVAAISCSGHGMAFVDGVRDNGRPVCECNNCYSGPDCSQLLPNCTADATRFVPSPVFLRKLF